MPSFPRTMVEDISLPRMLIGTNWFLGYCHSTSCKSRFMERVVTNRSSVADIIEVFLRAGIDAIMCPHTQTVVPDAIIHTGDFVERADKDELWRNFFLIEGDILSGTPLYPAVGRSDSPPELARRWFPFFDQAPWYSFDRGDAHFVVTDLRDTARQDQSAVAATGAQAQWLRAEIGRAHV